MNKRLSFGMLTILAALVLGACSGNVGSSSNIPDSSSKSSTKPSSVSQEPAKGIQDVSISLGNEGEKAYITVRGTQYGYSSDNFKWAWGLKEQNSSTFADGKATPAAEDYKASTFDDSNGFTVIYCLTDIQTMKAGTLYLIYGGTPESYGVIYFASNMFGANDATRKYYLRQDQDNALVFESIQPITYTEAAVVEIEQSELPDGVTQAGAYLKFGGSNSKNLTLETINSWHEAGNIAGDFQRVIPENSYSIHAHVDSERFWTIEGNKVFFYVYCGFLEAGEGWMVHFDLVTGNQGTGLQTSTTLDGKTPYIVAGKSYRVYSDSNKSGEENYWGCLGVYCDGGVA